MSEEMSEEISRRLLAAFKVDVSGELEKLLFRKPLPFLTGSRVYGFPREDSDWDVVLLVNSKEERLFWKISGQEAQLDAEKDSPRGEYGDVSLRYKEWNLIFTHSEGMYLTWLDGTEYLRAIGPVSREREGSRLSVCTASTNTRSFTSRVEIQERRVCHAMKLPVMKAKCATCPFREGGLEVVKTTLQIRSLTDASPFCHSTGKQALTEITGKPSLGEERVCRGARDFQIYCFYAVGLLPEPTEEAWNKKCEELGIE